MRSVPITLVWSSARASDTNGEASKASGCGVSATSVTSVNTDKGSAGSSTPSSGSLIVASSAFWPPSVAGSRSGGVVSSASGTGVSAASFARAENAVKAPKSMSSNREAGGDSAGVSGATASSATVENASSVKTGSRSNSGQSSGRSNMLSTDTASGVAAISLKSVGCHPSTSSGGLPTESPKSVVSNSSPASSATASVSAGCGALLPGSPCSGNVSPCLRQASALARSGAALHSASFWVAMSSTQRASACMASWDRFIKPGCAGLCSAKAVLMVCSIAQAASPNSVNPTMRELPLSVWKARRSVVKLSRSSGLSRNVVNAVWPLPSTSRASSRKMLRRSSSSSSSVNGANRELPCKGGVAT